MSDQKMEAPRRALMGRARFRLMVARALLAWWPIPAVSALVWALPPLSRVGLLVVAGAVRLRYPGRLSAPVRAAWWRSRWWFDARAAGLVVIADPHLNATHEQGRPPGIELAPALRRIRCTGSARLYTVRTLPGQTFATFDNAHPALAHRWGAQVAVSEHPRRRATVLIEVVTADALARPLTYPTR